MDSLVRRFKSRTTQVTGIIALLLTIAYFTHTLFARDTPASDLTQAQPTLPQAALVVKGISITAEIADEAIERRQGLSHRKKLEANSGMLFVYPAEQNLVFTMRHASIPLSIAFLDKNMRILEVLEMAPFTDGPYPSKFQAQFALEMNRGWFARNKVKPGDQIHRN